MEPLPIRLLVGDPPAHGSNNSADPLLGLEALTTYDHNENAC
jgi:hypothetical protein